MERLTQTALLSVVRVRRCEYEKMLYKIIKRNNLSSVPRLLSTPGKDN